MRLRKTIMGVMALLAAALILFITYAYLLDYWPRISK